MEQRGAEGITKFATKLCSPMQEKETVYIAPKHLQNNDLMTPWLQHELYGLEASSRKCSALYDSVFLPMHHAAITYLRDPV